MSNTYGKITDRQREILAVVIATADYRRVAETLGIAYVTVKRHLEDIKSELALPANCVEFGSLSTRASFSYQGVAYTKMPHATDNYGGYNAEDKDGKRKLFLHHVMVEKTDG